MGSTRLAGRGALWVPDARKPTTGAARDRASGVRSDRRVSNPNEAEMDDETKDTSEADQTASAGGAKPQATDADAPADRPRHSRSARPLRPWEALEQLDRQWVDPTPLRDLPEPIAALALTTTDDPFGLGLLGCRLGGVATRGRRGLRRVARGTARGRRHEARAEVPTDGRTRAGGTTLVRRPFGRRVHLRGRWARVPLAADRSDRGVSPLSGRTAPRPRSRQGPRLPIRRPPWTRTHQWRPRSRPSGPTRLTGRRPTPRDADGGRDDAIRRLQRSLARGAPGRAWGPRN